MIDRKSHWQSIYHGKSPLDVSWYQEEPKTSMSLICRSGLHNNEAIIDVGGGASVLVDYLYKEGFTNLSVLDISENALSSAKKRLGKLASNIEWFETDITEFIPPHKYSIWHDRAVFHFLTDKEDQRKYVYSLKRALRPRGHLIIASFSIGGPKQCSGLPIIQYDAPKLLLALGEDFEMLEEREEVHITPDGNEQKFVYFHLIYNPNDNET